MASAHLLGILRRLKMLYICARQALGVSLSENLLRVVCRKMRSVLAMVSGVNLRDIAVTGEHSCNLTDTPYFTGGVVTGRTVDTV